MNGVMDRIDGAAAGGSFVRTFRISAGLILCLTGLAKVWTAFGDVKLLTVPDPIVGISFKYLMLAVGVAELAIAAVCLFTRVRRCRPECREASPVGPRCAATAQSHPR